MTPTIDTRANVLLRRIFIGNGFTEGDIEVETLHTGELVVQGRVTLTPVMETETAIVPKASPGAAVYNTKPEAEHGLSSYRNELPQTAPWVAKMKGLLAAEPHNGWGMSPTAWPLPDLTRRFAFSITCVECKGKKTAPCAPCHGEGNTPCPRCQIQWPGQLTGQIQCPDCFGSARNPQNPAQACYRCQMARNTMPNIMPGFIPCPDCEYMPLQLRGFQQCRVCRGKGHQDCKFCQAKGHVTEETTLNVALQAEFTLGSLAHVPPAIFGVIDNMTHYEMAERIMRVEPDAADPKTTLAFKGTIPVAQLRLRVGESSQTVLAFGENRIMLGDVPQLLDSALASALDELNASTLPALGQRYRLIGELATALGAGQKPGAFFSKNYPYGISRDFAFALSDRIKAVFGQITTRPRLLAGGIGAALAVGLWAGWLAAHGNSLLNIGLQPPLWDILVALVLAALVWVAVDIAGRRTLKQMMPQTPIKTSPAGLVGLGAAGLFMAAATGLYLLLH